MHTLKYKSIRFLMKFQEYSIKNLEFSSFILDILVAQVNNSF